MSENGDVRRRAKYTLEFKLEAVRFTTGRSRRLNLTWR